jgi:uncharacterized SAM-binding protein YcdF (DUF218 family)
MVGSGVFCKNDIADFLVSRLTYVRHLPDTASSDSDVVYVLGGTPDSLKWKIQSASKLLQDRRAARVLVLRQQGIMAFSADLGRNLTTDEWTLETLRAHGIRPEVTEFVDFEPGFFGTWSEAQGLSRFARQRGYRRLILVTSLSHSRRTWESFSRTVEHPDARLFLYVSDESADFRHLLPEYTKLLVYRAVLF